MAIGAQMAEGEMCGMPYSLLKYISPAIIHTFFVTLFQSTGIILLVILLSLVLWPRPSQRGLTADRTDESRPYPSGYYILYWGMGILWLLDGLLQAQPPMATSMFVDMDVASNLAHQPHWLVALLGAGIQLWTNHQIGSAVLAVLIQVGIGVGILAGRGRTLGRVSLYVALGWSVVVWIYGEGLGGLFGSSPTWLSGTPGAVLLYMLGAVWLLLPARYWLSGQVARWTRWSLGGMWLGLAIFQAVPQYGFWSRTGLYELFRFNTLTPQPAWMLNPIIAVTRSSQLHPLLWNGLFVAAMAAMGIMMLTNRAGKGFWIVTSGWLLFSWWFGQDFGIVGGVGTDPQAAPLAALMMLGGWWFASPKTGAAIELHRPGYVPTLNSRMAKQAIWAVMGAMTAGFLVLGFVTPQIVEAQGDANAPGQQHIKPVSTAPAVFHPSKWMQSDPATHTVKMRVEAAVNKFGSLSFDGYSNGFMTITIPQNWTVQVTFINRQTLLNNSAMIVDASEVAPGGPYTPAFPGAATPNPSRGVSLNGVQHFHFIASRAGQYALISAVPDGQAVSGMWDKVVVSASATQPHMAVR